MRKVVPICDRCNSGVYFEHVTVLYEKEGKVKMSGHHNCMRDKKEKGESLRDVKIL